MCVIATLTAVVRADGGDDGITTDAKSFLSEAPARWAVYSDELSGYGGTVKYKTSGFLKGSSETSTECVVRSAPGCLLIESYTPAATLDSEAEVHCYNSQYYFHLLRANGKRDWLLKRAALLGSGGERERAHWEKTVQGQFTITQCVQVANTDLRALVKKPQFRVVKLTPTRVGTTDAVRLEFTCPHPVRTEGEEFYAAQSGVIDLDPKRFWCVLGYQVQTKHSNSTGEEIGELTLAPGTDPYPVPKLFRAKTRSLLTDGRRNELTHEVTFDLHRSALSSDDLAFTLSAYGMPEPAGLQPPARRTPTYVWLLAVAAAAAVVAGLFRHLARRQSAARLPG
jgi:hypothetical protein